MVHSYYERGKESPSYSDGRRSDKMEFCDYVDGLVNTQEDCAESGCQTCADELDEVAR